MQISIGSAFRNSAASGQVHRFARQALELQALLLALGHDLHWIAVEGDSSDDTPERLREYAPRFERATLVTHNHGGPVFGSTEDPERMRALAGVGNAILSAVPDQTAILVYVESDLVWDAGTLVGLMERLCDDVDVVAPLVYAGDLFYDIFAFRKDGDRFSPFPPFHAGLAGRSMMQIDSAGSCLVMKGDVARACRIGSTEGLVSFCADARRKGYRIWVDADKAVHHP